MLFDKGKLEKLTLRAFKPAAPGDKPVPSDDPKDMYVLQVNPSTYTLNKSIVYSRLTGQGDTATESLYKHTAPASLSFEFLFDGTGVVPVPSELGDVPLVGAIASKLTGGAKPFEVIHEIRKFDRLVHEFDGKIHRPRELLLVWGTLAFPCVLTSASYRYTLFRPDGSPLRAIATCSFCEHVPRVLKEREKNATSPDLTHLREVRDGDTLPSMAYEIYGKPDLYLEVARVNKLVNFRRLRPASRVAFPPVGVKP